jgi:hypothetical protein
MIAEQKALAEFKKTTGEGCSKMLKCKACDIMRSQQPPAGRVAFLPLKGKKRAQSAMLPSASTAKGCGGRQ